MDYTPGLPFVSHQMQQKYPFVSSSLKKTRFLPVLSYNYDYLPMNLESPKVFWIDLKFPPPDDFEVRRPVKLWLTPKHGIRTLSGAWNSVFYVDDIIGSRIILSPFRGSKWLPTIHQSVTNPFGWGYSAENVNVSPSMHSSSKYGFGAPLASLEYYPATY